MLCLYYIKIWSLQLFHSANKIKYLQHWLLPDKGHVLNKGIREKGLNVCTILQDMKTMQLEMSPSDFGSEEQPRDVGFDNPLYDVEHQVTTTTYCLE